MQLPCKFPNNVFLKELQKLSNHNRVPEIPSHQFSSSSRFSGFLPICRFFRNTRHLKIAANFDNRLNTNELKYSSERIVGANWMRIFDSTIFVSKLHKQRGSVPLSVWTRYRIDSQCDAKSEKHVTCKTWRKVSSTYTYKAERSSQFLISRTF